MFRLHLVQACPKLIDRFKEREENVKVQNKLTCIVYHEIISSMVYFTMLQMDVFNTFIELLRQTGNVTKGQIDIDKLR